MTIGCVFCDIIAGRGEASVVYRDEQCIAVMDIYPVNTGHVLIIPLHHARDLAELEKGTGGALFEIARQREELESVAATIRASLGVA